jgi:uncharacterized protein
MKLRNIFICAGGLTALTIVFSGAMQTTSVRDTLRKPPVVFWRPPGTGKEWPPLQPKTKIAAKILNGAKAQKGTIYNAAYRNISYPGGDVPKTEGACTDVVIRALRAAGFDLQKLIHEDMKNNFRLYPKKWGLPGPDSNIDHRRVPNQMRFFERHATVLSTRVNAQTLAQWQPGDIVCWDMQNGQLHTGIVSSRRNSRGEPYVIHNGWICIEDDALMRWKIIGHYRYPK